MERRLDGVRQGTPAGACPQTAPRWGTGPDRNLTCGGTGDEDEAICIAGIEAAGLLSG
jgi:hypothetical protein